VVELSGAASGFVVDTAGVELEGVVRSVNTNRDGSDGSGGHHESGFISGLNSVVSLHGGSNVGLVELASSILRNVGVAGFRVDTVVGDDVLHGINHETAIASLVAEASRAVHQVLLRETNEGLSSLENVSSFERSGGRERPARSALSLVLDSSYGILGSPVHRGGNSLLGAESNGSLGPWATFPRSRSDAKSSSEVIGLELIVGEITEFIHSDREASGNGIMGFNEFLVDKPNLVATRSLSCRGVGLGVSDHPFAEFGDVSGSDER